MKPAQRAAWLVALAFGCSSGDSVVEPPGSPIGDAGADGLVDLGSIPEVVGSTDAGDGGLGADDAALPSWFGEDCTDNADCKDDTVQGWCVQVGTGKQCTIGCIDSCPEGYGCIGVRNAGSDALLLCMPDGELGSLLCHKCGEDGDCGPGGACVAIGKDGGAPDLRCAIFLDPCPDGFANTCFQRAGDTACGCAPTTASCVCFGPDAGATRPCSATSELGACTGVETCAGADGWSGCTAKAPTTETCNGGDDDCDGATDESLGGAPCEVTNAFGSCPGVMQCQGAAGLACAGLTPAAEVCNGADDDCDGVPDDGLPDIDEDGSCDVPPKDGDGDGVPDEEDSCPLVSNPDQSDLDGDGQGDACDLDDDGDGVPDEKDNCGQVGNPDQEDLDADGLGDACDDDDDDDGVPDDGDCVPLDPAAPSCDGKACGDDGCGGSCGGCPGGDACEPGGQCGCVPSCAGKQCGGDGCGGSCGGCPSGDACDAGGKCGCVPSCAGKQCGGDGCGGTCGGGCPGGTVCSGDQCVCVPNCSGKQCGSDGCGGSCGGCSWGFECNGSDQCQCGPSPHFIDVGGACLPSCGALLGAMSLPDDGVGCCNSGCVGATAGGPGATWDCTWCCASPPGCW